MWCGSVWPDGAMTYLHVWFDGGVAVGMRGFGASCVGHGGMLRIFTLGGARAYDILGGGGAVSILGSRGAVGTLQVGGAAGTGTLGGREGRTDQWVIGGMVRVDELGTGRANCTILDNCISACVCSIPNCAVGEAGCGCWRAAMSSWIERVMFFWGERPGRTCSWGKKRTVSTWQTRRVSGNQI